MHGKENIEIVQVRVGDLNPSIYNPRKWDRGQFEQLKESLTRFQMIDPLIVNGAEKRKNTLIGGHMRLAVAKELGYTEVPVVYVNIPDVKLEIELNLRLNRNSGSWDTELLKAFDLDLLLDVGFDDADLAPIWDQMETEDDDFDTEKKLAETKVVTVKPGDLYRLGKHFLLCADSTDLAQVQRLMGGKKAGMVYLDPPYNISLDYSNGISTKGKYGGMETDRKTVAAYREFLKTVIGNALAVSEADAHCFSWCDESYIGMVQGIYEELGLANRRVCLWIKNNLNMTPNVAFNKLYEPCVYATRGKPYLSEKVQNLTEILNKEVDTGNRAIDDILDIISIWLVKRLPGQSYIHPTEKPVTLHEKPLRRCTKPGDIVLDLFAGSASTLIACEQMGRVCYTCERDSLFCQVSIDRFKELTGIEPELVSQEGL
jgi:DNA modification methylase